MPDENCWYVVLNGLFSFISKLDGKSSLRLRKGGKWVPEGWSTCMGDSPDSPDASAVDEGGVVFICLMATGLEVCLSSIEEVELLETLL